MLRKTQKQIAPCGASIKSMIEDYLTYIKNNPNHYWFRRKLYGWGWTPATWQGWVAILTFITFIIWNAIILDSSGEPTTNDIIWFLGKEVVAIIVLLAICYKKGETPKWQWGIPKEEKEQK
jgi:hypothetical protein